MNHSLSWMRGDFDPIQIEIDSLKSKLIEAYRSGDQVRQNLILRNLKGFEKYRATG